MKNVCALLPGIILAMSLHAQQNKFDTGFEGGPNYSFMSGNDIVEDVNDPRFGFSGGLAFQYNLPKLLSVRTAVSFERKGGGSEGQFTDSSGTIIGTFTIRDRFDYLTVPVLLRASFGSKVRFFANAGPYFGFLLKQTTKINMTGFPERIYENTAYFIRRLDFGVSAGIGVEIPLKEKISLSCEVRNNLGLYNISDLPVYGGGTIRTNSTNLLIGFSYKFGMREAS